MSMTQNAWENTVHLLNFTWPRYDYTMKIHHFTPKKKRFLTSENIMYGTRWLCFKTDEKKLIRLTWCWKGRCHYWKIAKLPRRQLFFYIFKLKHSWGYRRTWGPSRIYIYMYIYIYKQLIGIWHDIAISTLKHGYIHNQLCGFTSPTITVGSEWLWLKI